MKDVEVVRKEVVSNMKIPEMIETLESQGFQVVGLFGIRPSEKGEGTETVIALPMDPSGGHSLLEAFQRAAEAQLKSMEQ